MWLASETTLATSIEYQTKITLTGVIQPTVTINTGSTTPYDIVVSTNTIISIETLVGSSGEIVLIVTTN